MFHLADSFRHVSQHAFMLVAWLMDAALFLRLCLRPSAALAAENLFLRTQLTLYQERQVKPRRATNATRFTLVWLSQWFDWRPALAVVQPETFKRWQRQGVCLCWRWQSKPGRPSIPGALQALIQQVARDNFTWGQRRIAHELRLKLGLQVSPRTVRKYMPTRRDYAPGHHALAHVHAQPRACADRPWHGHGPSYPRSSDRVGTAQTALASVVGPIRHVWGTEEHSK